MRDDSVVEFVDEVCGIYFRSIVLHNAGDAATQHVHPYDHATLVCSGSVALWADGQFQGHYHAGQAVAVLAGVQHKFQALESNTRLTCVHHGESAERVKEIPISKAHSMKERGL